MSQYNPDTQPFDAAYHSLPLSTPVEIRDALIEVSDTIDFAKKILLQHRVKAFLASDVIDVARMILQRREAIVSSRRVVAGDDHGIF